ncbi:MAG: ParB N-terminal domain-containing protein [Candidatus Acidiferrales bacterium]
MPAYREDKLRTDQMLLDPNNYRFQDTSDFVSAELSRFHEKSVQDRAYRTLKETASVGQLKASIVRNGFIPVERIVVRSYPGKADAFVVIEGNRRLAALRWITEDDAAGVNVPEDVKQTLNAVPVVIVEGEAGSLEHKALMGVRHVSGISEWGGYQRAKLVVELRDAFQLDSTEVAERLAMSVHEVNRRYRAFRALSQMRDDEEYGEYAEPHTYPLFHEAVSLPAVREWLGWDDEKALFTKDVEREQFYALLAPRESEDGPEKDPKIATYQEVRQLREILANMEAKLVLLDPNRTFLDAVTIANREQLSKAWLSRVAAAVEALERVSVLELVALTADQRDEIEKLIRTASELLRNYEKLKK